MLTAVIDRSGVGVQHACGNTDERRLAGAILADNGVYFARINQEIDALERLHRTETLADACKGHHRYMRRGRLRQRGVNDVMHGEAAG